MLVTRLKGYARGTAARVGSVILTKWSEGCWSASVSRQSESVFGSTALRAYRRAIAEARYA